MPAGPTTLSPTAEERRAVRAALDTVVRDSLRTAAGGLAALYAVFAIGHSLLLPPRAALIMALVAAGTMVALVGMYLALRKWTPSLRSAHPLAAALAAAVLLNSLLHLVLLDDLVHSTNVALMVIGVGGLVLSSRWFAAILAVSVGGWAALALLLHIPGSFVHFAFMIFGATLLSQLIFSARLRTYQRLAQLHIRDTLRAAELELAMQALRRNEEVLARARDAAEAASRAKSAFLAAMSHELRTPLGIILGYSNLILDTAMLRGHEEYVADLRRIQQVGGHLQSLFGEALDLARIDAGRLTIRRAWFDVAAFVRQVADATQPMIAENTNTIEVVCPDDIGRMCSDEMRVRQVLLNLLSNASKFTERGTITLRAGRLPDEDRIAFAVSDTGIGMTPDQLANLFTEFSHADSSPRRAYGGAGLGLAVSRRLCQLLGGSIVVSSVAGEGTTFVVDLPAELAETPEREAEESAPAPALT